MNIDISKKEIFFEFLRYALVGGISFLVDGATLFLFREFIFSAGNASELFISTAAGFIAGLTVNYFLSLLFVFKNPSNSGKSFSDFLIFTAVGIVGLLLTEAGMYTGVYALGIHYMLVKVFVTGVVLIWNYLGRKIFVFGRVKHNG